ncbi:MAG: MOSC domain-containing protein, partial [Planctomycetota bacterium]|nr:MOSC domain-containing protein [Planctomycetota bacterium]
RSTFDPDVQNVMFRLQDEEKSIAFHLEKDREKVGAWLGAYLGYPVTLRHDPERGFHDDPGLAGPVIIAANTAKELQGWFPALDFDNLRRRIRPGVEMGGSLGFWEERLYSHPGFVIQFTVGKVLITGVKPADRNESFERDPATGEVTPGFLETFMLKRKEKLPAFVPSERFDHYYKLGVRTRLTFHEEGKQIRLGNRVGILERKVDAPGKE